MPRKANLLPFDLVQQISKGDLSLDVLKIYPHLSLFHKMKREFSLVFFFYLPMLNSKKSLFWNSLCGPSCPDADDDGKLEIFL